MYTRPRLVDHELANSKASEAEAAINERDRKDLGNRCPLPSLSLAHRVTPECRRGSITRPVEMAHITSSWTHPTPRVQPETSLFSPNMHLPLRPCAWLITRTCGREPLRIAIATYCNAGPLSSLPPPMMGGTAAGWLTFSRDGTCHRVPALLLSRCS